MLIEMNSKNNFKKFFDDFYCNYNYTVPLHQWVEVCACNPRPVSLTPEEHSS